MSLDIQQITVPFVPGTTVNCYLVKSSDAFVLVDTGPARQRAYIQAALQKAGCRPDNFKLIVLTHGDFDHCGNAAFLAKTYKVPIAMHTADLGMVKDGNMLAGRKQPNIVMKTLIRSLMRLSRINRFTPDIFIKEGDSLAEHGFDAEVIEIPGHSSGSVGLLTQQGELLCGDLLGNTKKPDLWSIMDDVDTAKASLRKLAGHAIKKVYPGHGQPFNMEYFWDNYSY